MSLRWRLVGALLVAVVVAVSAGTVSHMAEVSARLDRDLRTQVARVTQALRTEIDQTSAILDEELQNAVDARGGIARMLASGRIEARFLGAQARLQSGRLEILKVLAADGAILSSGHWPASFGALDPLIATYRQNPGPLARIVDEATPTGSAPALERWAIGRAGAREVVVVAGRFLDQAALERMRARVGADLVALCTPQGDAADTTTCLTVRAPQLLDSLANVAFTPDQKAFTERLIFERIELSGSFLVVGLDRAAIENVRDGIVRRAAVVGIASVLFAVLLGSLLAARMIRPIESLTDGASRLAQGDLAARVPASASGGAEVQKLVGAFNQMAADLERGQSRLRQAERVAAWQEIARGLAHELKNPLTPILGAMDVIRKARRLDRPDFDAILDEQATAVVEEVMRLKELSDAFARFARLPDRKPEPLVMSELVDHAVALYAGSAEVTVVRDVEPDLPPLIADRTQMGTVITNLVKNAVEAMNGQGRLTIRQRRVAGIGSSGQGEQHELCVEDTGPGIDPQVQARLFTPYVTTKGSRGTGLGLALVHRIVVEHGGTVEGGAAPGGGARFVVRVPTTPVPVTTTPPTLHTEGGDGAQLP